MKFFQILIIKALIFTTFLNAGGIGFLQNQRYVCLIKYIQTGDELQNFPQSQALDNPVRFYIDESYVFHTDAGLKLFVKGEKSDLMFSDGDNVMKIFVDSDKRKLISTNEKLLSAKTILHFVCAETDKWSINK